MPSSSYYYYSNIIIVVILLLSINHVKSIPTNYQYRLELVENKEGFKGKFLLITDIHLDPHYSPHSDPAQYCHRSSEDFEKNRAGVFGTLRSECDSPYSLINSTFEYLKKYVQDDIDFVIYTGDSLRHRRDPYLQVYDEDVIWGHQQIVKYFKDNFDLTRIKFMPTIGNNDLWGGPNTLFQNLTDIWSSLNLNLTEEHFIKGGGYFRQDVNSKLTVLSLNSMYFYESNDKIQDCNIIDSPGYKQLRWMEMELMDAKSQGINVYISQHITPLDPKGDLAYYPSCYKKYIRLLGMYADTILGHFTGHTNQDTLTLVTESDNAQNPYELVFLGEEQPSVTLDRIILVLNNAPSIIPVNNPAFRVYSYSTSSSNFGTLIDYTQYYTNLTKSTEKHKIKWEIEYVASEVYNITKLGTEDWIKVLSEFQKPNSILWEKYLNYINVGTPMETRRKQQN